MNFKKIFTFWKKDSKDDLKNMGKKQKKEFLSNDFIDRMIRVEQQVSGSLGERKDYNKTEYYKSLTSSEKNNYNQYLKNKHTRKKWFLLSMFLPLILVGFLNLNMTGNVINNTIGEETSHIFSNVLLLFILAGLFLSLIFFVFKRKHPRMLKKNISILNKVMLKREVEKTFGKTR